MTAAARRHHRWHEVLDDVDRAHQVDRDHLVPLLVGEPVDGPTTPISRRMFMDDVHARVLGMNVVGERGDVVVVGDIQRAVLRDEVRPVSRASAAVCASP